MKRFIIILIAAIFVLGLVATGLAQTEGAPKKPGVQKESTQPVANPEAPKAAKKYPDSQAGQTWISWIFVVIIGGFLGLLGLTILYLILWVSPPYRINLSKLISEQDGSASMSRFQLLVFTFVISSGLFIIIIHTSDFPTVNDTILKLLGISSGSYLGSKIIQTVKEGKGGGSVDT